MPNTESRGHKGHHAKQFEGGHYGTKSLQGEGTCHYGTKSLQGEGTCHYGTKSLQGEGTCHYSPVLMPTATC